MTHDELTKLIRTGNEFAGIKYAPDSHTFALRAVVELHKPIKYKTVLHIRTGCTCGAAKYPCPTIKAIEKELDNDTR
jgi:hypothetical protein